MFRSRLSKFVGALLCSFGLVVGGALHVSPSMAADGDSISVTVRVVDAETGALLNDAKLAYESVKSDSGVAFDNGETISIDEIDMLSRTEIDLLHGTEFYAQYSLKRDGADCYVYPDDAGSTVTCQAVKLPHKTILKAVDKDTGEVVPLIPSDVGVSFIGGARLSSDGKTCYYDDNYHSSLFIEKPGYLDLALRSDVLVENGETVVTLEKAPSREVTFKFTDALNGKELTDTEAVLSPGIVLNRRLYEEEHPIANGDTVVVPNYAAATPGFRDLWWVRLNTSSRASRGDVALVDPLPDSVDTKYMLPLKQPVTEVGVPTVHVRVVDEAGNPVEGAKVHIDDTFVTGFNREDETGAPYFSVYTVDKRVEDKTSGAEDVVYLALFNFTNDNECNDDHCYANASKIAISVQADGYETPAPVTFLHGEDSTDIYNALGMTLDSRVKYTSRDAYEDLSGTPSSYTEILGETVTITLTKNAAAPGSSDDSTTSIGNSADKDKDKGGKQAAPVNNLVATGSSVGIGILTAVLFIGTGLLLRRKMTR